LANGVSGKTDSGCIVGDAKMVKDVAGYW